MTPPLDLIGLGVGPFNLSLAALLEKATATRALFFDRHPRFQWHPEMMFQDASMQTCCLKDLVTPVDPTNPHSFLNYLVANQLFYPFLNTDRMVITRREFEQYCAWAAQRLGDKLRFDTEVHSVEFDSEREEFRVATSRGEHRAQNICVATGLVPRVPDVVRTHLSVKVFHAKSPELKNLRLEGKSVAIIGGGQTGIEVFRNAIHGQWGRPREINLITRRRGLEPLDESPFTNEYFTPNYVDAFWDLRLDQKAHIVASQKYASDGNTPSYLKLLYNDLYHLKHVERDPRPVRILACRKLLGLEPRNDAYELKLENTFVEREESLAADIVILCTGFESVVPKALAPLLGRIRTDREGRFSFKKSYAIEWDGPAANRIYALNFSRHNHGIMDPQTSLMAWRSAVVINDLTRQKIYSTQTTTPNFVEYGSIR